MRKIVSYDRVPVFDVACDFCHKRARKGMPVGLTQCRGCQQEGCDDKCVRQRTSYQSVSTPMCKKCAKTYRLFIHKIQELRDEYDEARIVLDAELRAAIHSKVATKTQRKTP